MKGQYILVGQTAVECPDPLEWSVWMAQADRQVGLTTVSHYAVSTVFLGVDHNHFRMLTGGNHTPILYETMIFPATQPLPGEDLLEYTKRSKEGLDQEVLGTQERWFTWRDAEVGHEAIVKWLERRTSTVRNQGEIICPGIRAQHP